MYVLDLNCACNTSKNADARFNFVAIVPHTACDSLVHRSCQKKLQGVRVVVFNDTFNNILAISCWSVLFVEKTGVPGKKNTDLSQVTDKLYHIMSHQVHHV